MLFNNKKMLSTIDEKKDILANSSLFVKYLISYIIVFAIPLLSLGILVYNYYFNALEKEVTANNIGMLSHIKSIVDTNISELNTIAYQIYDNPELTTYKIQNSPLDGKKGILELKNYIIGNNFINEVFVYYDRIGRTYSSSNTLNIQEFFTIYTYENWMESQFLNYINSIESITVRPSEEIIKNNENNRFITYFVPNPNGSKFDKKMVFFLIEEESIIEILKNYRGNIFIINKHGIVSGFCDENYLTNKNIQKFIDTEKLTESTILTFDGIEYFVTYLKSDITEWLYMAFTPVNEAMQPVISTKLIFLYGLLFVIITSGLVIACIMKLNYNPLKQLKIFAESKLGKDLNNNNEIEAVKLTIAELSKTSEELNYKITSNRSAIKEFLLSNLLQGNYSDIGEFNEHGKEINIFFTNSLYQVAILSLVNFDSLKQLNKSRIIEIIENRMPQNIQGYGINNIEKERIIFIFAVHSKKDYSQLKEYIYNIHHHIYEKLKIPCTIGIGNIYADFTQIGKSYIQAITALDYRLIKGKNKIIFFEEILPESSSIGEYPTDELEALGLSIIEGNIDQIAKIIVNIIDKIKNIDMPLFTARCLCFDIINTIIKSMCIISKEFINIKQDYLDVLSLAEFERVEELGDIVKKISLDICSYIQQNRKNQTNDLINRMVNYIENNYRNYNFSIQCMAEYFNMSPSNISHYFKKQTGQTISEYVDYLRIRRAKELLISSNDPLNQIVKDIGYVDVSSFVRKFKKKVGTTPGNFRKIYWTV